MMMMMGHLHALLHPHHTEMNRKNPNNWTFLCGGFSPFMHLGKVTLRKWVSIPNVVCPLFGSRLPWRTQPVSASVLFRSRSWPPYANPSGASERRCRMRCFGAYKWSRVDHPREHGPLEVFFMGPKFKFSLNDCFKICCIYNMLYERFTYYVCLNLWCITKPYHIK